MKVPTVERFLCVFDLNLGGLMLGYLGAISNATLTLLLIKNLLFDENKFNKEATDISRHNEKLSSGLEMIEKIDSPADESLSTKGLFKNILSLDFSMYSKKLAASVIVVIVYIGVLSTFCLISMIFIRGVNEVRNLINLCFLFQLFLLILAKS